MQKHLYNIIHKLHFLSVLQPNILYISYYFCKFSFSLSNDAWKLESLQLNGISLLSELYIKGIPLWAPKDRRITSFKTASTDFTVGHRVWSFAHAVYCSLAVERVVSVILLFVLYRLKRAGGQHGVTAKKLCQKGFLCPKEPLYLSLLDKFGKKPTTKTNAKQTKNHHQKNQTKTKTNNQTPPPQPKSCIIVIISIIIAIIIWEMQ